MCVRLAKSHSSHAATPHAMSIKSHQTARAAHDTRQWLRPGKMKTSRIAGEMECTYGGGGGDDNLRVPPGLFPCCVFTEGRSLSVDLRNAMLGRRACSCDPRFGTTISGFPETPFHCNPWLAGGGDELVVADFGDGERPAATDDGMLVICLFQRHGTLLETWLTSLG